MWFELNCVFNVNFMDEVSVSIDNKNISRIIDSV